jgi:hypothetical protein
MDDKRYQAARKYVRKLREFYTHVAVYVVVNVFLFIVNVITGPDWWFYWVSLAWGIGLAIHAYEVFFQDRLFGPDWEERKIRELMGEKLKRDRFGEGAFEDEDEQDYQGDEDEDDIPLPGVDAQRRRHGGR